MGKKSPKALKQHEIEGLARQQNRMNNPNVSNIFGSTTTTFGPDDQANIVQTLSPEMQGIINSQMDFVGQGPAQLGDYSNPFIQSMMQGNSDAIARRGGYAPGNASMMGGFSGFNPQFNAEQQQMADALGADPGAPIGLPTAGPVTPPANPAPVEPSGPQMAERIGRALTGMGGGNVNPYSQLGQNINEFLRNRGQFPQDGM